MIAGLLQVCYMVCNRADLPALRGIFYLHHHSWQTNMTKPSCRDRTEQALARIADPNGEGARACLTVYAEAARAAADASDARAARGGALGPLDGAIVSVKDLFD